MDYQQINQGSFSPTTFIFDVDKIHQIDVNSQEFKELLIRLYQNLSLMATILNTKNSGMYPLQEFCNGNTYFPVVGSSIQNSSYRQGFTKAINFGALPNATSISRPHNIQMFNKFSFIRIFGAATNQNTMQFIPLPYASANGTDNIQVDVDSQNVTITTNSDYSAYNVSYIFLEYLKN